MTTNKEKREQEDKWEAERKLKKIKETETVVISLFAAFIFLLIAAFTGSSFFMFLIFVALTVAIFTGR
jgi:hypothetical protein